MLLLFPCVYIPTDLAIQVAWRRLERDSSLPEQTSITEDYIMSAVHVLGCDLLVIQRKSVPAGAGYCNGIPSFSGGHEPHDGRH